MEDSDGQGPEKADNMSINPESLIWSMPRITGLGLVTSVFPTYLRKTCRVRRIIEC